VIDSWGGGHMIQLNRCVPLDDEQQSCIGSTQFIFLELILKFLFLLLSFAHTLMAEIKFMS
jgi:hypothetical protein